MLPSQRKCSQSQHGPPSSTERIYASSSSFQQPSAPTPHRNESRKAGSSAPPLSLDPLNSPTEDYVFPMSSVVSLRPSSAGPLPNLAADEESLTTTRFRHIMTEEGHAVIVGRDGDPIQRCEDEPIHIPGAVQSFGVLIALQEEYTLREEDEHKLKVRVVSENSEQIIGYTPNQLFQLNSFCDILSEEQSYDLLEYIDFIRGDGSDPAIDGPQVFTLVIRSPKLGPRKLWCAIHRNGTNKDLIICELELEDDPINPLAPPSPSTAEPPEDVLHSRPTAEEYAESTIKLSKPLRVMRSARSRKGEAAMMEVFSIMTQVQEQLANALNLETFFKVLVGIVKELTGFHRVMIYQFDQVWNGKIVAELFDTWATKDLYKGLNFPASDIPAQARDLYRVNKVRLLYDREQETSRLVGRTIEDVETPLDLTFSYIRAMSPIHIKYLKNMAVRASMSISIDASDKLWGLIVCHSHGSKGMRVPFPVRKMCRMIGDCASQNVERLSYASRLQARKLINTVSTANNPIRYITASSEELLSLFDANFGLLSIDRETKIIGKVGKTQEAIAILEYLRLRKITTVTKSCDIQIDFPDLIYAPGFTMIAGLLLVPLSVSGSDFIVFFRHGQTCEVRWAGNPHDKSIREGTDGHLEPRSSFAAWSEAVVGKCKEWTEEQIEITAAICLVYGKFIEVWRQNEATLHKNKITKLLLANSAHEVRTPLNAMINYLEIALEGNIDQETREYLHKSHSASKSIVSVINDLLDLTKVEEGRKLTKDEVFDFSATVREEVDDFVGYAKLKGIELTLVENPVVPPFVVGDQRRVRQVISNVIANAIQNTSAGAVQLEVCLVEHADDHVDLDVVIQDTGVGMSAKNVDSLFRDLEHVQSEDEEPIHDGMSKNSQNLGLGLAQVGRLVRNMNGQLRLNSAEGEGSRFVIRLGFGIPDNTHELFNRRSSKGRQKSLAEKSLALLRGFRRSSKPNSTADPSKAEHLSILVAEDDPINRKVVQKRLEKLGHSVYLTVNGEDCANAFRDRAKFFDAVLMDIQMPIVDGLKSTTMIRSFEKTHPAIGRVPIFAVSASLVEKDRQLYVDGGFDGWIPKPIDFKRLSTLLMGIVKEDIRGACLYEPGAWERGGWLTT